MNLADDRRWQRFNDREFSCPCCGLTFNGVFDIAVDHPDPWPHGNLGDQNDPVLKVGNDKLGTDLCQLGEDYFIRTVLEIPIRGSDRRFGFGVWVSQSRENFDRYVAAYGTDREAKLGETFGWLANTLPGYDMADPAESFVRFRDGGNRPNVVVTDPRHPVAQDQVDGITFDRLLDIYAAQGTDLRPHLGDA